MRIAKGLFILIVISILGMPIFARQVKRVYITLDVSGSMKGNKYEVGNYTAQLISVVRESADELTVYYLGVPHRIASGEGYKSLHLPFDRLPSAKGSYHEISDLRRFMDDYKPQEGCDDWLFVIGDGDWDWNKARPDYDSTTRRLGQFIADHNLHVCYLQTGNDVSEQYAFTQYLTELSLPGIEIRKSDTTLASVRANTAYFANKIMGFSDENIAFDTPNDTTASFATLFPLRSFTILLQEGGQIAVESIRCGGAAMAYKLKGNPSTKAIKGRSTIEGMVWECARYVPSDESIDIRFSRPVTAGAIRMYPRVDARLELTPLDGDGQPLAGRGGAYATDKANGQYEVCLRLYDSRNRPYTARQMQLVEAAIDNGAGSVKATYRAADSSLRAAVPMTGDSVRLTATAEAKGYFRIESSPITIAYMPLLELPAITLAPIAFERIAKGGESSAAIDDSTLQQLGMTTGAFACIDNSTGDSAQATIDGKRLTLRLPHSDRRCECAYPDIIRYSATIAADGGIVKEGKRYSGARMEISLPIERRPLLVRCRKELIYIIVLLFVTFYLHLLRKKPRFAPSARLTPSYYNLNDELKQQSGTPLRKKGLGAWISRWLLPHAERSSLTFNTLGIGLKVYATDTRRIVMDKGSYNPERMNIAGIDPARPPKELNLSDNSVINISAKGNFKRGNIAYTAGSKKAGAAYKTLLLIMSLACCAAVAYLAWKVIDGM